MRFYLVPSKWRNEMQFKIGGFVTSKQGRDKDKVYIILQEEKEYVYVIDGKTYTKDNPKKKNKKHIQIIHKSLTNIEEMPTQELNLNIQDAINQYEQRSKNEK